MWRLRKLVQKLWLALIGGMGFGVLANIIYEGLKGRGFRLHPDVIAFVLRFSPWFGIGLTAILVISLLSIISTRRKKVRESLQQAFEVFKPARELHPADLGFQVLSTGVPAGPHFRPYYSAYVTRKVVPHRQVLAGSSVPLHTEEDLLRALREGRGILILGRPLEGKTRTVFEIARRMDGYHVLSPRSDRPIPADDTFSLLRRQRVLLLLEDLNDYVGATLNLSRFCKKLDQYASAWAIAATCRDGPELEAVRKAWGSSLGRVYEGIPLKTALLPLVEEEKERLAREIGRKWDPGEGDASPTPGAIVMGGALEAMHRRFMVQPPEEKEILRALKLLMASGILPLTHHRLQVALREVFNLQVPDLNHSLELLATQAFLHEPGWQDPIQAEPAYLSDVVDYSAGKGTSDDFFLLVRAFSELGDAEALFYLGATYATTLEDYRQALHCFDEVLTHMPDSIDAWNNKGTMLWHLDLKQDAIQAWDRALALKPDESDVWFNKGIALEDTGRATEALASYDRALELNPSSSDVWGNKCVLLNELGRSQEALDACTKALEIEPDSPEYWSNKASALIGLARHEDALVASEEALRIAPAHAGALNNKAAALSGLGRYDEAVLALSRALELEPDDPQLWHNLGLAEAYLEHQKEALSAFDHAVQLNPADHEAWYNRGDWPCPPGTSPRGAGSL